MTTQQPKPRHELLLDKLLTGACVGTDNETCRQLQTNQVPDLVRQLRNKGIDVQKQMVKVVSNGRKKRVAEYWLDQSEIDRLTQKAA